MPCLLVVYIQEDKLLLALQKTAQTWESSHEDCSWLYRKPHRRENHRMKTGYWFLTFWIYGQACYPPPTPPLLASAACRQCVLGVDRKWRSDHAAPCSWTGWQKRTRCSFWSGEQRGLIYINEPNPPPLNTTSIADKSRDFPGGPVAKTSHSQCKGECWWLGGGGGGQWLGSISGQGTRSHMPQLKILHVVTKKSCIPQWRSKISHATTKTRHSQRNKLKIKKYKNDRCYMTHSGDHQSN